MYQSGCEDGKGTHISVITYLMCGENDDDISWPYTGTVTIDSEDDCLYFRLRTTNPKQWLVTTLANFDLG